jgi:hypothetical protein
VGGCVLDDDAIGIDSLVSGETEDRDVEGSNLKGKSGTLKDRKPADERQFFEALKSNDLSKRTESEGNFVTECD